MRIFLIKRLVASLFVLYVIATIMFFMVKLLPGDPTMFFLQEGVPTNLIEQQKTLWGLHDPLSVQYVRYLKNLFTFDFGVSFRQSEPVRPIIVDKLLNTAAMMLPAFLIVVVVSVLGGAFIGWKRGSKIEQITLVGSLFLRSMPSFFLGILLLVIFSFKLNWLPSGGMRAPGTDVTFLAMIFSKDFLLHLILPVAAFALREINGPLLVMRTSMLETIGEQFIEVMRAEGLPEWRIIWHAARNAFLPMVTYLTILIGFFFRGQVLLETVFAWPGIGQEIVSALTLYDFPIAQAAFFITAVVVVTMNLISDILYGFLDPRIRYD